jgi:hypothetical protein
MNIARHNLWFYVITMESADALEFSTAEVCAAAGVSRVTFEGWLLRNLLDLPPGPGTGRSRHYSRLDAVRIAVVTEFTRLGIGVGFAVRAASKLTKLNADCRSVDDDGWTGSGDPRPQALILGATRWPFGTAVPPVQSLPLALMRYKSMDEVGLVVAERFGSDGFALINLSTLIPRVLTRLTEIAAEEAAASVRKPKPSRRKKRPA